MNTYTIIRASRMIDGTGKKPVNDPVIVVKDDRIHHVSSEGEGEISLGIGVKELNLEGQTILPGLRARSGRNFPDLFPHLG